MRSIAELLAALEDVQARADRAGIRITVVGGVAAYLHVIGEETELTWPLSLEAIASIRRVTNDLDVVEEGAVVLVRDGGVDRLPGGSPRFAGTERHATVIVVGARRVRVVLPSLFVVYKAIAYADRAEERDLADVAATALRAAAGRGSPPEALAAEILELLPSRPGAEADLCRVAERFRTPDDFGTTAFLNVIRAAVSVTVGEAEFADDEDRLRELIWTAARRLLDRWTE